MAPARGTAVILLGVALLVATLGLGAATAPERDVGGAGSPQTPTAVPNATPAPSDTETATPLPDRPQTLVGIQGGWVGDGSVVALDGREVDWRETSADGYFEVSRLDDGTIAAAYANESATDCGPYAEPCARTGYRIIDPDASGGPEVVAEYSFPAGDITNREVHAVDRVGDDGFVFTDMDAERVVLVEGDEVAWQWNASSFYEAPPDPTQRDWLHINDVDAIGDGRFLVSVRNANQIVIVERGEGVVEVINEDRGTSDENCLQSGRLTDADGDGDVRCGDPDVIKEQHNPQWLGDGAVLVADSENDRVVELHRTENGTWEPAWVLREAGGIELDWPRDADRLPNGNTLITDSRNKRVIEVTPQGDLVWSVATDRVVEAGPGIPYEADRLPFGESTGEYGGPAADEGTPTGSEGTPTATPLPQIRGDPANAGDTGTEVPGLSLAVAGLQGTFSWFPFWFGELHLVLSVLAVGLIVSGSATHLLRRFR